MFKTGEPIYCKKHGLGIVYGTSSISIRAYYEDKKTETYILSGTSIQECSSPANITLKTLVEKGLFEIFFDEVTKTRGRDYYRSGFVSIKKNMDNAIYASVEGSRYNKYDVKLGLNNNRLSVFCDCPVDGTCKHMYATFLLAKGKIQEEKRIENAINSNLVRKDILLTLLSISAISSDENSKFLALISKLSEQISTLEDTEKLFEYLFNTYNSYHRYGQLYDAVIYSFLVDDNKKNAMINAVERVTSFQNESITKFFKERVISIQNSSGKERLIILYIKKQYDAILDVLVTDLKNNQFYRFEETIFALIYPYLDESEYLLQYILDYLTNNYVFVHITLEDICKKFSSNNDKNKILLASDDEDAIRQLSFTSLDLDTMCLLLKKITSRDESRDFIKKNYEVFKGSKHEKEFMVYMVESYLNQRIDRDKKLIKGIISQFDNNTYVLEYLNKYDETGIEEAGYVRRSFFY